MPALSAVDASERDPRAIPATLNLALTSAVLAGVVGSFALPVMFPASPLALVVGAVAFGLLKEPLFGLLHEADHRILHPNRLVNDAVGVVVAATLPSSYRYHRLAHLAHHAYNRCKKERVEYYFATHNRWKRNAFYFFILFGGMWLGITLSNLVLTVLPMRLVKKWRIETNFAQPLPPLSAADLATIRVEFVGVVALHVAAVVFTPLTAGQMGVFLLASAISYSQLRHLVHYGASFDVIEGAYDLKAPAFLWPLLMHGNLHLAHHRHPSVPWNHLPEIAQPQDAKYGYFHMLAQQWKGCLSEEDQLRETGPEIRIREPGARGATLEA